MYPVSRRVSAVLTILRGATRPLVFQHCKARDDRHGAESYLTHACKSLKREPVARIAAGALQA